MWSRNTEPQLTTARTQHRRLLTAALASAMTLCAPLQATAAPCDASTVVAVVDQEPIYCDSLRTALRAARTSADPQRIADASTREGVRAILEGLIETRLLAAAARVSGIDRAAEIRHQVEDATAAVLAHAVLAREVEAPASDDAALRRYFAAHRAQFRSGMRVRARHIVTRSHESAERASAAWKAGRDFSVLAREQNIDASRARDGDLGWIAQGVMVRPFEQALFALRPGEVSDVVRTRFGYHLIRVEEIDEGKLPEFEAIRGRVRRSYAEQLRREVLSRVRAAHSVQTHERAVELLW